MFAGSGAKHQHGEVKRDCFCRDLIETIPQWIEQKKSVPADWIEPQKSEFPGFAFEKFLGMPFLTPALTVEEWIARIWQDVRQGCAINGMTPPKITWSDLGAYERFTGCALPSWIVRSLFVFDTEFLSHYKADGEPPKEQAPPMPSRPSTRPKKR